MSDIKFKPGCRTEADKWTIEGEKITSPEKLEAIKKVLEREGPILVDHRFLRGGCGPATLTFDDYEYFIEYLTENARIGDCITVWSLWPYMRDTEPLASGKCPDVDGAVPLVGPY